MRRTTVEQKYPDVVADVRCNLAKVYAHIDSSAGPTACWTWSGGLHKQGYGMTGGYRMATQTFIMMTVHRLLLKQRLNSDLAGQDAVHICTDPTTGMANMTCVNPAHLFAGCDRDILLLRYQHGNHFGKKKGYRHTQPRRQKYAFGIDNIVAVAQYHMDMTEWLHRTGKLGIDPRRARQSFYHIRSGYIYRWAKLPQETQP
jgi:hypothetical protein